MTHVKEIRLSDRSARAVGVVESDKRDKTRKVRIDYTVKHPKYGKYLRWRTFLQAHDEQNLSRRGMCVRCSRPPEIGARLLLQLRLPGDATVDVIGQARWTRVEFERGSFGARAFARVGVELLGGAPGVLERYDRALARLRPDLDESKPAVASPGGRR